MGFRNAFCARKPTSTLLSGWLILLTWRHRRMITAALGHQICFRLVIVAGVNGFALLERWAIKSSSAAKVRVSEFCPEQNRIEFDAELGLQAHLLRHFAFFKPMPNCSAKNSHCSNSEAIPIERGLCVFLPGYALKLNG